MEEGIEHKGSNEKNQEVYQYTFTLGDKYKLGEPTDEKYAGINIYDEIISLKAEQFKWALIKKAYNLDMNKPEDFHKFWKKVDPEYSISLEELKARWDDGDDLV